MQVNEMLLAEAKMLLEANREQLVADERIVSIGCFGCGFGCSDTVGG
jgi:hypothetical protein